MKRINFEKRMLVLPHLPAIIRLFGKVPPKPVLYDPNSGIDRMEENKTVLRQILHSVGWNTSIIEVNMEIENTMSAEGRMSKTNGVWKWNREYIGKQLCEKNKENADWLCVSLSDIEISTFYAFREMEKSIAFKLRW